MPLPSLHPLPANPTTGQQPLATLGGRSLAGPPPPSAAGCGRVNKEVLKALQDVEWSDDEDDPDCLLCAEPLDLSDLNFKPCQCGMQICQFCYNRLLSNDARCPGCRRPYDAKKVVFQPVDFEEVKRAKERKTRRAKTIKQLSSMGRRHLLGVRVVMKNTVYVVGMKLPASNDEAITILRSNDYFGQYGKISKLYLRHRNAFSSTIVPTLTDDSPSIYIGIYIVYGRREDAARAILALDGIQAPSGPPGQILRATNGTARYCDAFLRGLKCDNAQCHDLHEWGGDSDCFTKDDMQTAVTRPAEYDARQKQALLLPAISAQKTIWAKPSLAEDPIGSALPNTAGWGKSVGVGRIVNGRTSTPVVIARPGRVPSLVSLKSNSAFPPPSPISFTSISAKNEDKRKLASASAMSRGRSADSTLSTTGSSVQNSPKKRSTMLAPITAAKSPSAIQGSITPPPGLSISGMVDITKALGTGALAESSDEPQEESLSAESEAGPSSSSPAPQTPARDTGTIPPSPLTGEPIFVHSPYEEPRIFSFPTSDPGFAFVLGIDDDEVQRRQAQAGGYQPSPFSKTLVGLAELGVLSPELPQFTGLQPNETPNFTGCFQPFDSCSDEDVRDVDASAQTSRPTGSMQQDGPRTTSRFEFARNISGSTSRGQSPFAMRRLVEDPSLPRDTWSFSGDATGSQSANDNRASGPAAQVLNFANGYSSTNENGWAGESGFMAPRQAGGFGRDERADLRRMEQGGSHGFSSRKGISAERVEFDPSMLQYGSTPSLHSQRAIFSPDGLLDDEDFRSHHAFAQIHPRQHSTHGYPEVQTLQQYHQQRGPSPSPLLLHGYRRF